MQDEHHGCEVHDLEIGNIQQGRKEAIQYVNEWISDAHHRRPDDGAKQTEQRDEHAANPSNPLNEQSHWDGDQCPQEGHAYDR